jgi:hypothetical protein
MLLDQLDRADGRQAAALLVRRADLQGGDDLADALQRVLRDLARHATVGAAQSLGPKLAL